MITNFVTAEEKIRRLREELKEEETALAKFNEFTDDKKLAIQLHGKQCHWNHTDGCDWFYRKDDDPETWTYVNGVHRDYLVKAQAILAEFTYEQGLRMIELI